MSSSELAPMLASQRMRLATEPVVHATIEQIAREGARRALQKAIEDEVAEYLNSAREERDAAGRRLVVRNGYKEPRKILSGLGPIEVKQPRVNDRRVDENGVRFRFTSKILPPYLRKTKTIEDLVPWLYLKGISTGEMSDALVHLGFDGAGLSATSVTRMTEVWQGEYEDWSKRGLAGKHYVYFWADGIHVQARLENDAQCLLVIIGATPEGNKELVGLTDGVRENAQSWKGLLLDLKRRGLVIGPELAIADGALGFWRAIEEVWPKTRGQRCWVHKTANVLNRLPKSQQSKAKRALQDIWMAETKNDANAAFDAFVETYAIKYDKAVGCLTKDREALLAFYDLPAEH